MIATSRSFGRRRARGLWWLLGWLGAAPLAAHPGAQERQERLAEALARAPEDSGLWVRSAIAKAEGGDPVGARQALERAETLGADEVLLERTRARLAAIRGDLPAADEALTRALRRDPENATILWARGTLRLHGGRTAAAAEDLDRAWDRLAVPTPDEALLLARTLATAGRRSDALRRLDGALQRWGPLTALSREAVALETAASELERALERVDRLIVESPVPERWWVARAELLERLGRIEEGRSAWQEAARRLRSRGARARAAGSIAELEARVAAALGAWPAAALPDADGPVSAVSGTAARGGRAVAAAIPPSSSTLERGPYLQAGSSTRVVVRWRTAENEIGRVWIGDAPESLAVWGDEPAPGTDHEVAVDGLAPGTLYAYGVGSAGGLLAGGDGDHVFVTAPPSGTAAPLRIWAIGDAGTADANAAAVRDAYVAFAGDRHTDFWMMLGDNAYPSGTEAEYDAAVFDMYPALLRSSVVWPTLGNHDAMSADGSAGTGVYFDLFTLPIAGEAGGVPSGTEAYYSFDWGNVHVICLDSHDVDRSPGGAMATWLEDDLLVTDATWVVAFWHHPPYSRGSHDSDVETPMVDMRESLVPVLEAAGVDLVLTGHSHAYERSRLIDGHYGPAASFDPVTMVRADGDGDPAGDGAYPKPYPPRSPHAGAIYVVAGSSGKVSAGAALDHPALPFAHEILGSVVLDVDGPVLDLRFLGHDGLVHDAARLEKPLFADGFESGGTAEWSSSAPASASATATLVERRRFDAAGG